MFKALDNILSKQKLFSMLVRYNTNTFAGNKTIYVKMWYEHAVKLFSDFFLIKMDIFYNNMIWKKLACKMFVQCNIIVVKVQYVFQNHVSK